MNMKEFGPGGARPWGPLRSTNGKAISTRIEYQLQLKYNTRPTENEIKLKYDANNT